MILVLLAAVTFDVFMARTLPTAQNPDRLWAAVSGANVSAAKLGDYPEREWLVTIPTRTREAIDHPRAGVDEKLLADGRRAWTFYRKLALAKEDAWFHAASIAWAACAVAQADSTTRARAGVLAGLSDQDPRGL